MRFSNLVVLALALCQGVSSAALRSFGNVSSTVVGQDAVDFELDTGAVARVEMLDGDLVRVRANGRGQFNTMLSGAIQASTDFHRPGATIQQTADGVTLTTPLCTVIVHNVPFQVDIQRADGSIVTADVETGLMYNDETGTIFSRKIAPPDEAYFGFGARGGPINRRGRSFLMHNVDASAYGEFSDPLYISIPFFYGVLNGEAYGLFVDSPADPFFDMDSAMNGSFYIGASAGDLDYYVMTGPDPSRISNLYGRLTGFNRIPPKWSLGYHQSRYGYKSQDELLNLAAAFRSNRIPCDVLWMDIDYLDRLNMFTWNSATFPSPAEMNQTLDGMGFKRVNIIEPVLKLTDPIWSFADQTGFLVQNPDTTSLVSTMWFGEVTDLSFLDFTKDSVRSWYKQSLTTFLAYGMNGLWADLNEPAQNYMPQATYDFSGNPRTDLSGRNLYALRELSLLDETQRDARPKTRPWAISRSGYSGIQRYAANWSGDTNTSFDSFRVSLEMSVSMGLSGQNFFGHDIGGFLGSPSAELFTRWLAFGSYIPLFRNHAVNTADPREPWAFGEPYTSYARNIISQRYRMLPYLYSVFHQAATVGAPVVAPLVYYFPQDAKTYAEDASFMFGPSLMVAPVVTAGAVSRPVYLPAGSDWFDTNTDISYPGGAPVNALAPLDRIPVYARAGAIVPGGPVMQYVTDPVTPALNIDLYPGPDASFTLYEDDGASMDYAAGGFLETAISRTTGAASSVVKVQRSGANWTPPVRTVTFQFHAATAQPSAVFWNALPLARVGTEAALQTTPAGWFYRPGDRRLIVSVPDSNGFQITVSN